MPRYLTAAEVEGRIRWTESESACWLSVLQASWAYHTIQALAQRLADTTCGGCGGCGWIGGPDGRCPSCRDYPPDRRGKAYRDAAHAIDSLGCNGGLEEEEK